jgi:TonB family protein
MSILIDVALRSSAILLAGLGLRAALRRRSAAVRHLVLAGALLAASAVAPLSLSLPSWTVSLPIPAQAPAITTPGHTTTRAAAATLTTPGVDRRRETTDRIPATVLARVWSAGFFALAAVLAIGLLRLARVARHASVVNDDRWRRAAEAVSREYGLRRPIVLLQTDVPDVLATCGVFRPRVLLPSHAPGWPAERIHVVLCHELAHIRRLDWAVQIGAEVVRAVLWFNPLVWIACTCLRRDSEQACDDLVLGRGVAARDYATHLLNLARQCRRSPSVPLPALPMARRSTLERRISDMLNPRLDRRPASIRTLAIAGPLLVAVLLPTATLRARQTGPATLSGTVYDVTGAVMPGVAITLEDATQMKYTATTDVTGRFGFSNVQPGQYTLEASLAAFRTMRQEFELRAARDWDRAITLQVGTLRESITVSAPRAASPAASAKPAQPARVGGTIRAPLKTLDVRPVYPASMRDAGREGVVPLEATIGVEGTVTSVRVLSAQVHPDFAIAAVDAVRQWRFTPTLLNGSPVDVVLTVSVAFTLSDR